jgi:hypothetical protein
MAGIIKIPGGKIGFLLISLHFQFPVPVNSREYGKHIF